MDSNNVNPEDSVPSPTAKKKSTRKKFSSIGCPDQTGNWILPPSIKTLPSWMEESFEVDATWSPLDFPARISALLGNAQESTEIDQVSFSMPCGSFAKLAPDGSSWRTSQVSLFTPEWSCISASEMGAPHKRDRVWIISELADSERNRTQRSADVNREETEGDGPRTPFGGSKNVADSEHTGSPRPRVNSQPQGKERQPSDKGKEGSNQELADSEHTGLEGATRKGLSREGGPSIELAGGSFQEKNVADSPGISDAIEQRLEGNEREERSKTARGRRHPHSPGSDSARNVWGVECRLGRTPDGLPDGVDPDHECLGWECGVPRVSKGQKFRTPRLMGLGNAIVPQIATYLGHRILEMEKHP